MIAPQRKNRARTKFSRVFAGLPAIEFGKLLKGKSDRNLIPRVPEKICSVGV